MSSNSIHALEGLKSRLKALHSKADRVTLTRDQLCVALDEVRAEATQLQARHEVLTKVLELYRVLMDKMVAVQVRNIENLVSEGLSSIFYDQDLSFGLEIGQHGNKISASPYLRNGSIVGDPLDSFGGGPASIVSLILRVLVMLRLKKLKMLFLDETLAAVSEAYVETTSKFLCKLAESSELPILMVTHTQAFLDHADNSYQGGLNDAGEFVAKKLRG